MTLRYLSVALRELEEAIQYYEDADPGLGLRFYSEVRNAIERIKRFPEAWQPISKRTRQCRTKVFPFGIIYSIRGDEIVVVAVAHLKRRPGYWKDRVS